MSNKLLSSVIVTNLLVRKKGQRVCFQIKLPPDAIRIVGIETCIRSRYCRPFMPWMRDFTAGLLTLRAPAATDICYSSHVMVEQSTLLPSDLGYREFRAGIWNYSEMSVNTVAQSAAKEPDILNIVAPNVLNGYFLDNWGVTLDRNLTYRLSIHLWITVNDLYNTSSNE